MCWEEYEDLRVRAQKRATKLVITLDVVNSKEVLKSQENYKDIENYIGKVYSVLEKRGYAVHNDLYNKEKKFQVLGDLFAFTVNTDIDVYIIQKFLVHYKEKINLPYTFHFNYCKYETDDWIQGSILYFIGYAVSWADKNAKQNKLYV